MNFDLKSIVKRGTHFIKEPIKLNSGIKLVAERGTVLVGGVKLTKFYQKDGVYVCDLNEEGIQLSEMTSRGFSRPIHPSHNELFVDSMPMNISQYPKKGSFLEIIDYGEVEKNEWNEDCGKIDSGFYYDTTRPNNWDDNNNIWVHGYWSWDWANTYERIDTLDKDKMFIKTHPPYGMYKYRKGQRFYFLNIPEEVTNPGDYCIDYDKNLIYFIPFYENPREVFLSVIDQPIFVIDDSSDICIDGFRMECVRGNMITVKNSSNIEIKNCEIRNVGNIAIKIEDSRDVLIEKMYIHDIGDSGVAVTGGDRATLKSANVIVRNCTFHDIAKWSRCYQPAISLYGVGLSAIGNLIHDCPHSGILYGGNEITITHNEIYRVVMETGDAGAIYSGRNYAWRGNVVSHNFIHHLGGVGMGTMGIYNDDCLSGTYMEGNMFYKVNRAVFLGGGRDFTVLGNVFIDCTPSIEIDGRGTNDNPVWIKMVNGFMRKQFYDVSPMSEPYISAYPELKTIHEYYENSVDGVTKIPPSALMEQNIICSERKIEYTWNTEDGEFVERDNVIIDKTQLEEYLTPEQYEKYIKMKFM